MGQDPTTFETWSGPTKVDPTKFWQGQGISNGISAMFPYKLTKPDM